MGEGPNPAAPDRRDFPPDDADLDAAQEADGAPDDDRESIGPVLCPNCMTPNEESAHLCRVCMTPLSSHATIDPIFSISARGDTFSKATRAPRSPIIFIGIWLLFAPISFFLLIAAGAAWSNESPGSTVLILALAAITIAILFKTTKNYVKGPPDDREGFPLSDYKADTRSQDPEPDDDKQSTPPSE